MVSSLRTPSRGRICRSPFNAQTTVVADNTPQRDVPYSLRKLLNPWGLTQPLTVQVAAQCAQHTSARLSNPNAAFDSQFGQTYTRPTPKSAIQHHHLRRRWSDCSRRMTHFPPRLALTLSQPRSRQLFRQPPLTPSSAWSNFSSVEFC